MTKVFKENTLRVSPKVRLVANCDRNVNTIRAEHAAGLRVSPQADERKVSGKAVRGDVPNSGSTDDVLKASNKKSLTAARGSLKGLAEGVEANVFITLAEDHDLTQKPNPFAGVHVRDYRQRGRSATATVQINHLDKLAANSLVAHVGFGDTIHVPDVPLGEVSNASTSVTHDVPAAAQRRGQSKVLLGIIDVGGFDFAHEDFVANGKTQFQRIWDMGATGTPPLRPDNKGFNYGHEILRTHMEDKPKTIIGYSLRLKRKISVRRISVSSWRLAG